LIRGEAALRRSVVRVVQKHFVRNDRDFVFAAKAVQSFLLMLMHVRASRVIGMNHNHSASALGHSFFQRRKIHLPAVIVNQG